MLKPEKPEQLSAWPLPIDKQAGAPENRVEID